MLVFISVRADRGRLRDILPATLPIHAPIGHATAYAAIADEG